MRDQSGYHSPRTPDGKILKSSSIYIRGERAAWPRFLGINYDISLMQMLEQRAARAHYARSGDKTEPERITLNVNDLLDDLIEQSVELVGKPVALMNKDDKVRAIRFSQRASARCSSDKVRRQDRKHFGISKYTLYSLS